MQKLQRTTEDNHIFQRIDRRQVHIRIVVDEQYAPRAGSGPGWFTTHPILGKKREFVFAFVAQVIFLCCE
jgi:hypothetical protein